MIEMRWVVWDDVETVPFDVYRDTFGGKARQKNVTKRKLQYRQMIDTAMYAAMGPFPDSAKKMAWSEWRDVPEVVERDMSCP